MHPLHAISKSPLIYFPILNNLTGNVNASLMLAEIIRLAGLHGGVFYKYIILPNNPPVKYRDITSWTSDLNMSRKSVLTALRDITSKHGEVVEELDITLLSFEERIKYFCSRVRSAIITRTLYSRVTQYTVNMSLLEDIINEVYKTDKHIKIFHNIDKKFLTFNDKGMWEGAYTELKEEIFSDITSKCEQDKDILKEMIDFLLEEQLLYFIKERTNLRGKNLYNTLKGYFNRRYNDNEYQFNFLNFDYIWYSLTKYSGSVEYRPPFKLAADLIKKYQKQGNELSALLTVKGLSIKLYCRLSEEYLGKHLKISELLDKQNVEKIVNKLVA